MPPKPFPYPLRIGVDMCSMPRLGQHITDSNWLNRYTRKHFNRLEWPELCIRVAAALEGKGDGAISSYEDKMHRALFFPAITTTDLKGDERSPAAQLLRFLAGRYDRSSWEPSA